MSSNFRHHAISGLISCVFLAGGIAGFAWLKNQPKAPAAEPPVALPPLVTTVPLRPHGGTLDISVDGSVAPFREISTSAEVAGRIIFRAPACDAGRFVTKGTLLLRIDPQDYELLALQLQHQLDEADASIEELAAEVTNTKKLIELSREDLSLQQRELARMTKLAVSNVVTESDLDRAKQVELAARNALVVLENQLKLQSTRKGRLDAGRNLVETQLARAKLDIERTEVMASTDGVIVADLVEEGDYVQKGAPLVTLEDTSAVEVKCSLQMDELAWLWRNHAQKSTGQQPLAGRYEIPQAPVTVTYELPQSDIRYQWKGRLSSFDGIGLDQRTRTVPCRIRVDDPLDVTIEPSAETGGFGPPALVRGMYVGVKIQVETMSDLVQIPESAVHPGKAVWVAREDHLRLIQPLRLIELIEITTVAGDTEKVWIADAEASKLQLDDAVIVTPLTAVTDRMPIRLEAGR